MEPPGDPAEHAAQFARDWADRLDEYCAIRMEELGVPFEQIGASDHLHGIDWCAFNPFDREGGGVGTGGRINVDSGSLNLDHVGPLGPDAAEAWAGARLRDRIDAVIAHEFEEARGGTHEFAYEHAPDTALPIGERTRALLRRIREGERSR